MENNYRLKPTGKTKPFEKTENIKKKATVFKIDSHRFDKGTNVNYRGGVPLYFDKAKREIYVDASDTHTLVYGSTGSLKTRAVVMPTINILCYAGESMIINDSKGELTERHASILKKNGYKVIVINLREPAYGNAWNPLAIPYHYYQQGDYDKAAEFANDIAVNLMTSEMAAKDPFWDYSASDMFYGLVMLLFRFCKEKEIPEAAVNIANLLSLKKSLFINDYKINDNLWEYASEDELIAASLSGTVAATGGTRGSIVSVFDQKMRIFAIQPTLLDLLSHSDFDLDNIDKEKTAIFLITPDEKTSYHKLVSLFVKQSYEYIIDMAMRSGGKVQRRINYILDEFSSLPKIADMPAMISAARSRDIRFLLIAQSKHQMLQKYQEDAQTIATNCANWIFLTSRELELLKEISELCGEYEDKKGLRPNISVSDLQHYDKEARTALLLSGRLLPFETTLPDIDDFGEKVAPVQAVLRQKADKITVDFKIDLLESNLDEKSLDEKFAEYEAFLKKNLDEETDDDFEDKDTTED